MNLFCNLIDSHKRTGHKKVRVRIKIRIRVRVRVKVKVKVPFMASYFVVLAFLWVDLLWYN